MSRVSVKAKTGSGKGMREMQRIRVGMRWMGWGISVGMRPIWVQMQNILGIRVAMQGIKVETKL